MTLRANYQALFPSCILQRVCREHMERVACSAAAVHRERPAITSLESAAVLLGSLATAVNRVSSV